MAATMAVATAEAAERRWSRKAETKEAEPAVIAGGGASVAFGFAVRPSVGSVGDGWNGGGGDGDGGGGDGGGGGGAAVVAGGGASVTFACAVGRSRLMTRLTDEGQTSGSITAGRAWDEIPSLRAERDVKLH